VDARQARSQPYSIGGGRGVLNTRRSQHPGHLRPGTRPAVLGMDPRGGRPLPVAGVRGYHPQKCFWNWNVRKRIFTHTKGNIMNSFLCFLWTIRDSWRREWITATRFVNFWKLGGSSEPPRPPSCKLARGTTRGTLYGDGMWADCMHTYNAGCRHLAFRNASESTRAKTFAISKQKFCGARIRENDWHLGPVTISSAAHNHIGIL